MKFDQFNEETLLNLLKSCPTTHTLSTYSEKVTVDGLWLEFGVSSGASLRQISESTTNKVYGFDCWTGLPEDWVDYNTGNARHSKGDFISTPPTNLPDNVELISGLFEESIPPFVKSHKGKPIALIHIDCDLYSSTKTIFDNMKEMFVDGTIILFDELVEYDGWQYHEFKAFKEFLQETQFNWDIVYRHGPHQVGIVINR